ncbi:MAG TPA: Gfo/Idh/MocA family oxidoreductase [Solirubrobacterales bacterium]|nr:Gfo/Idh/MocA family oxidoreductase [Solirubrobacterales bacterium]
MRVAVAGLGGAAVRGHLPALAALEAERRIFVVGACDPDRRRRVDAERLLPGLVTFGSAAEMLTMVESDLLVIAADPSAHADLAMLGAANGQHILCEKPAGITSSQLAALAAIREQHPDRGLIASYQYRFSRQWSFFSRFLKAAARSGRPVKMSVDVMRPYTDQHAVSDWREDPAMGGGLADHAVHFIALARELGGQLEVLDAERRYDGHGRERVTAHLTVGESRIDMCVSYQAPERSTQLAVACDSFYLHCKDSALALDQGSRGSRRVSVPALSSRGHVDALYGSMYQDLLVGIGQPDWRRHRAEELLDVSRCLTVLLATAEHDFSGVSRLKLAA